jgi:hypothetical protein
MISPERRFEMVCNELGWGDATGGLWFLGIEEGSAWEAGKETEIERHYNHTKYFRDDAIEQSMEASYTQATNRSQIDIVEARIAAPLSASWRGQNPEDYRKRIWKTGSGVAHANLYPLGKKQLTAWPAQYATLFGFAKTDTDHRRYVKEVKATRFARLIQARSELKPQAIVCLGKICWSDFREALGLAGEGLEIEDGKVIAYRNDRVVLAPHFAYGWITHARAALITNVLAEWGVSLP